MQRSVYYIPCHCTLQRYIHLTLMLYSILCLYISFQNLIVLGKNEELKISERDKAIMKSLIFLKEGPERQM